jgi:hypothetical protein
MEHFLDKNKHIPLIISLGALCLALIALMTPHLNSGNTIQSVLGVMAPISLQPKQTATITCNGTGSIVKVSATSARFVCADVIAQ